MSGAIRAAIAGWLWLYTAACDVGEPSSQVAWSIQVVTDEAGRVATGGPLRIAFDRRLSPWSVDRSSVGLSSGLVGEFVFPWFDPLSRELVVELTRPLLADTAYVLTLSGLRDLDGRTLPAAEQILIQASGSVTDIPAPPRRVPFDEVRELLAVRCGGGGCHSATDRAAHVVLEGTTGIAETVRGRPSQQSASVHDLSDTLGSGLIDLPVVDDQGASSSVSFSYLMYKALGDEHVLGEPMPPPAMHDALTLDELGLVARWIRTGAALE